jgi:hypothetical protein
MLRIVKISRFWRSREPHETRVIAFLVALSLGPLLVAQDKPKFEIFGGYSLEHISACGSRGDPKFDQACGLELGDLPSPTNYNGWNVSFTGHLVKYVGLTADFSGHYGNTVRADSFFTSRHSYMFGPVVAVHTEKFTPFAHALFGGVSENVSGLNILSYTTFARAIGGGLDVNVSRRLAVRLGQFDYEWVSVPTGGVPAATGFRYSGGVVFKF